MSGLAGRLMLTAAVAVLAGSASAAELSGLRQGVPLTEEASPPPIARPVTDDRRRLRAYPEQPPVIPHNIEGYQLTLNANRCLTCHARQFSVQFQAPMISVTHFMDRDGQVLGSVSPRRFFCTACHLPQTDAAPIVANEFVDIDALLARTPRAPRR